MYGHQANASDAICFNYRQDAKMDKSEDQDFNAALQRYGYNPNDFKIVETDTTQWKPNEIVPITGTITITHKATSTSKEYRTGMGSTWLIEFENDLKTHFYS